jgi:nitroimidazol reductase NimA-like FMN-containing flavoprotein (pyridoxamine 5'-phosphate oxidase superfamily)
MASRNPSLSSVPLTRDECLRLLDEADVARVLLSLGALPAALPARIALSQHDHLVISSRENVVQLAARRGDVISVQIDGLDSDDDTWSVMVTGIAGRVPIDEFQTDRIKRISERGAALVTLPLSVVTGQRGH